MSDLPKATIDVLQYLSVGGASSEDLIEKFGEAVKDRISVLIESKLIKRYEYPRTKITYYTLTDAGKNYIQDISFLDEQNSKQEIKTLIRWIVPVLISATALLISVISIVTK
jgi:predicted transcriptional regulator